MRNHGFSLIELIVAIFIFSLLALVAGGSFVSTLNLQRRALNIKRAEENGRFVLELMSRELRVANPISSLDAVCPSPGSSVLRFQHPVNGDIEYSLIGDSVHRLVNGTDTTISNPDVKITRLNFCLSGNDGNDGRQPKVAILLSLRAGEGQREEANLDLQTSVSPRVLND